MKIKGCELKNETVLEMEDFTGIGVAEDENKGCELKNETVLEMVDFNSLELLNERLFAIITAIRQYQKNLGSIS